MQDLFFGLTNQKLVDLSLDRKVLEAPRVREYLSYSRVPLDDHNGFYYNGERRDGMLEKVVGKSELL
jgi:hypothetical protein